MSPNPFDLDRAIEELTEERPQATQRSRSWEAVLGRPKTPSPLRLKGVALAGATALALLLLVPSRSNAYGWNEVVRRTQGATFLHITYRSETGKVVGEQWRNGPLWASWRRDKATREITHEMRSDDHQFYSYVRRPVTSPNGFQYGTLWNKTPQLRAGDRKFTGPAQTIDALINAGRAKVVGQEKVDSNGSAVQRFTVKMYGTDVWTIDTDPNGGRIQVIRYPEGDSSAFDYPQTIDAKLFSYRSRLTRDVAILDERGKEDLRKEPFQMPAVIYSRGPIHLRGVNLTPEGNLFVTWTGLLPSRKPELVATKTGKSWGPWFFQDGIHPLDPVRARRLLYFRAELPEKIGDQITLRFTTPQGPIEFKNVPIKRLKPLTE